MNFDRKKAAGMLLCIIGFCFYCQSALDMGYLRATQNDFKHLYVAGYLAERGGDFFDVRLMLSTHGHLKLPGGLNPFVYPPFFALILIPLSKFSYNTAWFLFTVLSHAAYFTALAFIVRVVRKEEEPRLFWWGILLVLSACNFPLMKTYSAGQMNAFMLLVIAGGAFFLSRNRQIEAGCLFGLGAAIKISPAFLLLYCCWTKRWRAFTAGCCVVLLSVLISVAVLGVDVHSGFLAMAKDMGYGSSTWSQFGQTFHVDPFNQAPSALWYHLFSSTETAQYGTIKGVLNAPWLAKVFSYLTAFSIFALLGWLTKRKPNAFSRIDFSLWTIAMLLLPSLLWDHYLIQALFAVVIALRIALYGSGKGVLWLGIAITIIAMPFMHHLPVYRQGWMTAFMSFKLFGLLLLMGYLVWVRDEEMKIFPEEDSSESV